MYEIYFSESEEGKIDYIALYESRLDSIIEALGASGDFSISFVSDEEIRKLNSQYREKDEPTDVLTFRLKDDESFPDFGFSEELGDIFISLDAVGRNASSFGVPFSEELTRIMLHGVMHLMGFDHESNDFTKEEMLLKQEDIMTKLGYKC